MNCDSGEEPKNSLMEATTGRMLMSACGVTTSISCACKVMRSRMTRSIREKPTELVLQKLAHAADTAVAKVIDIVHCADAVRKVVKVVDGRENVVDRHGFADQTVAVFLDEHFLLLHIGGLVQNGAQLAEINFLVDAVFFGVKAEEIVCLDSAVGNYFDFLVVNGKVDEADTGFSVARATSGLIFSPAAHSNSPVSGATMSRAATKF